jgi:hypothetical protein
LDWSSELRKALSVRAQAYAQSRGVAFYSSLGASPTVLFEPSDLTATHGNFIASSYHAIHNQPDWLQRTKKAHAQRAALPQAKQELACEMDSCNSSDALLMNIFCYPGAAETIVTRLFPGTPPKSPEFGVSGNVSLVDGVDATEIDMRIGDTIFEAKLTERDFTSRTKAHLGSYTGFAEVFEASSLPQTATEYQGYQLIRNVLAAQQHSCRFYLICDARRPDLVHEWWKVYGAVRHHALRRRCGLVFWQEIAAAAPSELRRFLREKYDL